MNKIFWQPSTNQIQQTQLWRFMQTLNNQHQTAFTSYAQLYQWSIDYPEKFWSALWDFTAIISQQRWHKVLNNPQDMLKAQWFTGARLNYAENLLRYRDQSIALIAINEQGQRRSLTYAQLYTQVAQLAAAMRAMGIQPLDRVAGLLPNILETVIAMLASASIGAIWSCCSPDFGSDAVVDRFSQITPKLLFSVNSYQYNGCTYDLLSKLQTLHQQLPSIEKTVIIPYCTTATDISHLPNASLYADFLAHSTQELNFASLPFNHPLYILYSSGTTGVPKCIVHSAGGTLLQHLKELVLHTNLQRQDSIFYYTTCGWMMWNWLISSLATGATVMLYDGSPLFPKATRLFNILEQEKITIFGTSAKYISAIEKAGLSPKNSHNLNLLRTILSTGSPLLAENFDFIYQSIKADLCLSSISGGTDIISCFALGNPILPVYRGELQCLGLGMKVQVFNEQGQAVIGEKGELVCTAPFPSMPVGFWNDPEQSKYHEAYFTRFPNVWAHGDFAELTPQGGMIIYGRADAVLKPGGVRIGTAEIYRIVEQIPDVVESVAIGQEWRNDVRIILFVKLRPETTLTEALKTQIKTAVRNQASPHHVPAKILQVADIPHTINGKVVELAIREVIHGRPVKNQTILANPEALTYFANREELTQN